MKKILLVIALLPCATSVCLAQEESARIFTYRYYPKGTHSQSNSIVNIEGGDEACMRMAVSQASLFHPTLLNEPNSYYQDYIQQESWGLCSDKQAHPIFRILCTAVLKDNGVRADCVKMQLEPLLTEPKRKQISP